MQNAWVTWALPFGMIGFWLAADIVELTRTPNPPRDMANRTNRITGAADTNRPIR